MRLLLALLLLGLPLLAAADAPGPRIIYSKSFPGSRPPFVKITLNSDGSAVYQEAEDDEQPIKFKLPPSQSQVIFDLAAKLDHFKRPMESGLKVANMGMKTFRWENGSQTSENKFNYSTDTDVQAIADWFERIAISEVYYLELEKRVRFDRIGVNQAILLLETGYDKKRLVALDQYLPLLDRVAKNDVYLNMARERAAKLAEVFRAEHKGLLDGTIPPVPSANGGQAKADK